MKNEIQTNRNMCMVRTFTFSTVEVSKQLCFICFMFFISMIFAHGNKKNADKHRIYGN